MADTVQLVIEDIPDVIHLAVDVRAGIAQLQAIPKEQRKARDYALAFGADPNGVQMHVADLIDKIEAQLAADQKTIPLIGPKANEIQQDGKTA